jgi:hypothetical protein
MSNFRNVIKSHLSAGQYHGYLDCRLEVKTQEQFLAFHRRPFREPVVEIKSFANF